MRFRIWLLPAFLIFAFELCMSPITLAQDIVGKTIAGYQGWFAAAGDGSPVGDLTGGRGNSHLNLETYPDMREFPNSEQFPAPASWGVLPDGNAATIFASDRDFTINRHVAWMKQYGIDCASVQRFGEVVRDPVYRDQKNEVTSKMMTACEKSGVKFYIEYDTSGSGKGGWGSNWLTGIESDWSSCAVARRIINSPAYARENGRTVVELWGLGLNGNGIAQSPVEWSELIRWFKAQGCYVIGGVPTGWLGESQFGDAAAGFSDVYPLCDAISPWVVGRFRGTAGADSYARTNEAPELAWCNAHSIAYIPCVYPGTSFYNSNGKSKNIIPREHGLLLWEQMANLRNLGIKSCFVSMFDEYNEATAIAKSAENVAEVPNGMWFLCLDADGTKLSSDYYLRLVHDGISMIKGDAPLTWNIPTNAWNDVFSATSAPIRYITKKTVKLSKVLTLKVPNETGDLSKRVSKYTLLYYNIDPEQDAGRYAGIEIVFSDGRTLSSGSCVDQNGYLIKAETGHGGGIPLHKWTTITSNIGQFAGMKIKQVYVAYSAAKYPASGAIEDIRISN